METPDGYSDLIPLADPARFQRRFPMLCQDKAAIDIQEILVEATSYLEDLTSRRLAPFTNLVYEEMANGINPNEYGDDSAGMPMGFAGTLGISYANALGANDLVRNFFLDQYAPQNPELWTYNVQSIKLFLTYGNSQAVELGAIYGPEKTNGFCRLPLGTFCPEGTRIVVEYSGGYTLGIPPSLSRACMFQAAKFLELEGNPQEPHATIDTTIMALIDPWMRY